MLEVEREYWFCLGFEQAQQGQAHSHVQSSEFSASAYNAYRNGAKAAQCGYGTAKQAYRIYQQVIGEQTK